MWDNDDNYPLVHTEVKTKEYFEELKDWWPGVGKEYQDLAVRYGLKDANEIDPK